MEACYFVYGRVENGERQRMLSPDLQGALHWAMRDIQEHRATPLGIRWGQDVLYDGATLQAIWEAEYGVRRAAPE